MVFLLYLTVRSLGSQRARQGRKRGGKRSGKHCFSGQFAGVSILIKNTESSGKLGDRPRKGGHEKKRRHDLITRKQPGQHTKGKKAYDRSGYLRGTKKDKARRKELRLVETKNIDAPAKVRWQEEGKRRSRSKHRGKDECYKVS